MFIWRVKILNNAESRAGTALLICESDQMDVENLAKHKGAERGRQDQSRGVSVTTFLKETGEATAYDAPSSNSPLLSAPLMRGKRRVGRRRLVRTAWDKWLVPNWISYPSWVRPGGRAWIKKISEILSMDRQTHHHSSIADENIKSRCESEKFRCTITN